MTTSEMDAAWVRVMGSYTDRTLTDVYRNVYVDCNDKKKRKSLTLNEQFILWKISELCEGRSENPYMVVGNSFTKIDNGTTFDQWLAKMKP